jgi:hypothetical protein
MAAVERERELPGGLAPIGTVNRRRAVGAGLALAAVALVLAAGCVPPDDETATFDPEGGDRALPSVTEAATT